MTTRSTTPLATRCLAAIVLLTALAASLVLVAPLAEAQQPVTGTADFRNAPQLAPGVYSDRIVTGDSAWYSVAYTNNADYNFEVALDGVDPSAAADVELVVSFVAPTLDTLDGPAPALSGSGFRYPTGHTNIWFLKVSLTTAGQTGIEYPIQLTVEGVQSEGTDRCDEVPSCTLDDQLRMLNGELAKATSELTELQSQPTRAAIQQELSNLAGFVDSSDTLLPEAEQRLARANATIAELCAPEVTCETFPSPGTKTPLFAMIVGALVLAFGLFRAVKKIAGPSPLDDESDDGDGDAETKSRTTSNDRRPMSASAARSR